MTLKDLSLEHSYYASRSNFYSNEAQMNFRDWEGFYEEFSDADVDMNLVFRWDVFFENEDGYSMQIIIIAQRKGIYMPIIIESLKEENVPQIVSYLKPHFERLQDNWNPLTNFFTKCN